MAKTPLFPTAKQVADLDNEIVRLRSELRAAKAAPAPAAYSQKERIWQKYLTMPPGKARSAFRSAQHALFEGENLAGFVKFRAHG